MLTFLSFMQCGSHAYSSSLVLNSRLQKHHHLIGKFSSFIQMILFPERSKTPVWTLLTWKRFVTHSEPACGVSYGMMTDCRWVYGSSTYFAILCSHLTRCVGAGWFSLCSRVVAWLGHLLTTCKQQTTTISISYSPHHAMQFNLLIFTITTAYATQP